jgi:catechol 2,3-dioxygenase-like lactoylglutathione lyase family enzyme
VTLWVPDLGRAELSWGWLLGELGYAVDSSLGTVLLYRDASGFTIALEQSPDMVPGMLYSRLRPGVNHLAFVASGPALETIRATARVHGWTSLAPDRHPIAGGAHVAYFEDRDGFEVELVTPDGA